MSLVASRNVTHGSVQRAVALNVGPGAGKCISARASDTVALLMLIRLLRMTLSPLLQPHAAAGRSTVPLSKRHPFARPLAASTPPTRAACASRPLTQCTNSLSRFRFVPTQCSNGEKEAAKGNDLGRSTAPDRPAAQQDVPELTLKTLDDSIQLCKEIRVSRTWKTAVPGEGPCRVNTHNDAPGCTWHGARYCK